MLDVERWAELRREHFVRGVSIKELARRTGLARNTVRAALRSDVPPGFWCPERPSRLDPFKDEIHRLLREDPRLPGVRVRELIEPLGFDGGKTIVDDYLREVRPLFVRARTHQRTVYRPGEICQWDLWEPSAPVPGRAWPDAPSLGGGGVSGLLARRRRRADLQQAGAGRLVGDVALSVVVGRAAGADGVGSRGLPARRRRAPDRGVCRASAGSCRSTGTSATRETPRRRARWSACRAIWRPTSSRAAGSRTSSTSSCSSIEWFEQANARTHKTLRARPIDRLIEERAVMRALPAREPDVDRRWVTRVAPDPLSALRHQRLLAGPEPGRAARRGARRPARDHRGRAGHGRARLPARALVRQAPHDHRARARPRAARAPRRAATRTRSSSSARSPSTSGWFDWKAASPKKDMGASVTAERA